LPGPERVDHAHREVGAVERQVVVAPVPQDHVRLLLGRAEDGLVVDACVDDGAFSDVGLVFLPLLQRHVRRVEIVEGDEALEPLAQ